MIKKRILAALVALGILSQGAVYADDVAGHKGETLLITEEKGSSGLTAEEKKEIEKAIKENATSMVAAFACAAAFSNKFAVAGCNGILAPVLKPGVEFAWKGVVYSYDKGKWVAKKASGPLKKLNCKDQGPAGQSYHCYELSIDTFMKRMKKCSQNPAEMDGKYLTHNCKKGFVGSKEGIKHKCKYNDRKQPNILCQLDDRKKEEHTNQNEFSQELTKIDKENTPPENK